MILPVLPSFIFAVEGMSPSDHSGGVWWLCAGEGQKFCANRTRNIENCCRIFCFLSVDN